MGRIVDLLDASRMTAPTSSETSRRVSAYFGDSGPFSYQKVRRITPVLLAGEMPYEVAVAGIAGIKFELARKCNLDVAELVSECKAFRGRNFYPFKRVLYSIDREFAISLRPETVAAVDGVPNLIFLQPRKHATLWPYNASFMRRVLEEVYIPDYFERAHFWLIDTEALSGDDRESRLVDLLSVEPMDDREFNRRIAALRAAWRLYLSTPKSERRRPQRPEDRQMDFGWED